MLSLADALKLKQILDFADTTVRADLIAGVIAHENDYTSNLTSQIRRIVNAQPFNGFLASAFVLRGGIEQSVGADACIIIANETRFKVCIFEAKWPRLSSTLNSWDYLQPSGVSHFHSQLTRQAVWAHRYAIWEMFYLEFAFGTQPAPFPDMNSGCVPHRDALAFDAARANSVASWTDAELSSLVNASCSTIGDMIALSALCHMGVPFEGTNYEEALLDYPTKGQVLVIKVGSPHNDRRNR